jgi:DNA-binding GntR family transcriptional regulator
VVAAHHRFASTPNAALDEDPAANERWTEAHRRFHEACAAACASSRLITYRTQLYDQSELIRQLAKLYGRGRRDVAAEHAAIAGAVIARDAETADALLRRHIDATRRSCLEAWEAGGLAGDGGGAR